MTSVWRVLRVTLVGYGRIYEQALRTLRPRVLVTLACVTLRVTKYGLVGATVAATSYLLLYVMHDVLHWPRHAIVDVGPTTITLNPLFLVEGAVCVELNYFLNRYVTWRDRRGTGLWHSWSRFHSWRAVTFAYNNFVFIPLLLNNLDQSYWVANTAGLIVGAAFNYTTSDMYAFAALTSRTRFSPPLVSPSAAVDVGIVIPCKRNDDTIGQVITALLAQTYVSAINRKLRIVLVGDPGDPTWQRVPPLPPATAVAIEIIELDVESPGRDANAKRAAGINHVASEVRVIGLMDADVMPPKDWLANAVSLIVDRGEDFIAGPVHGIGRSTFWTRFIDRTRTGSKTPRVDGPTRVTVRNVGAHKLPVTANLLISHRVWQRIGTPRPEFTHSYEDYEFGWRALKEGFTILLDPTLEVFRVHRVGMTPLMKEYRRSAHGYADFSVEYPDSIFTALRLVQLSLVPWLLILPMIGHQLAPDVTFVLLTAAVQSVVFANVLAARRLDGVLYPLIGAWLSLQFVYGVCLRFAERGFAPPEMPNTRSQRSLQP